MKASETQVRECRVCKTVQVVGRGGGLCMHTVQVSAETQTWDKQGHYHKVPAVVEVCRGSTPGERP